MIDGLLSLFVRPSAVAACLLAGLSLVAAFGCLRMAVYETCAQCEHPAPDWFRFDLYRGLSIANFGIAAVALISLTDPALMRGQIDYGIGIATQAGILTFVYARLAHVFWGQHPMVRD